MRVIGAYGGGVCVRLADVWLCVCLGSGAVRRGCLPECALRSHVWWCPQCWGQAVLLWVVRVPVGRGPGSACVLSYVLWCEACCWAMGSVCRTFPTHSISGGGSGHWLPLPGPRH